MPDITMCANKECKKRENCYRATAKPDAVMQSWSMFVPDSSGFCRFYYSNRQNRNLGKPNILDLI